MNIEELREKAKKEIMQLTDEQLEYILFRLMKGDRKK